MKRTRRPRNRDNHLYRRQLFLEQLEDRRLLAGVTMIVHGHSGDASETWVAEMTTAIVDRLGGEDNVAEYVVKMGNCLSPQVVSVTPNEWLERELPDLVE